MAGRNTLTILEKRDIEKRIPSGELSLRRRGLKEIPEEVLNLRHLTVLDLTDNSLTNIKGLENLSNLTRLDLTGNELKYIDIDVLKQLPKLSELLLRFNPIENHEVLGSLKNLTLLDISLNSVVNYNFLENLQNLSILFLDENDISNVDFLANLTQFKSIDLSKNNISDISPLLKLIEKNVTISLNPAQWHNKINLAENPITNPPLEIVQQGNEAILRYFAEKEKGAQKLMEAKLLIVGQGGAGKTSLKRKLHDVNEKMPEPKDTTRGIEVTQLDYKTNNGEDFRLNIWDFGGQNVQHYAHQFFLTGSSLYALVTNEREQNPNFQYWLNIIEMMGGKSPVLIVQNEIAGHSEPIKNAAAIRERFDNVVNPFQQVDLSKASTDGRFKNLKEAIIHHAMQLPHIGKEYPTSYVRVREALEREAQAGKHYITWKEYNDLCRTAEVDDPNVMQDIATTFTILGVCLHFKDDIELHNFVFLNPKWIIDALFELLYHPMVMEKQGKFSETDTLKIWNPSEYETMHGKLIRLMERFELCYNIKDSRHYIVPQRLPAEQQSYGWQEPQATRVEYEYKFMPKGIITRLTCRLHEKIEEDHVWNDAVIFEMPKARAFVREVYAEEKIAIEVSGEKRADLLNRILDEVDDIHRKSNYANLQVEKKVPCSCAVCIGSKVPYFFNYDYLVELLDDGEYDERCQVSRKKVDIREVLLKTGIDFKKDRKAGRMEFWNDLEQDGLQKEAEILIKKLNHLRAERAKSSDAAQVFTLDRQIEETEKRLAEIRTFE